MTDMWEIAPSSAILVLGAAAAFLRYGGKSGIGAAVVAGLPIICGALWNPLVTKAAAVLVVAVSGAAVAGYSFRAMLAAILPGAYSRMVRRAPITATFGLFVISCTLIMCFFAGAIAPFGEAEIVGDVWETASSEHLLGTDNLGRDMYSRLVYGARTTVFVAVAASILSFAFGMVQSFAAAVVGGLVDHTLSRVNDLLLAIPTLVFALVVLAALPQNVIVLICVMAVIDQTRVFRLGRAVAVDVVVQDFFEAARLRGERWGWLVFREVLPNVLTPLVAEFGLRFAYAILFLSSLSFLGLGIQPPQADWGSMVKDNKDGLIFLVPAALYPGIAVAVLAVSVNMVVDWIQDHTASMKGGRT